MAGMPSMDMEGTEGTVGWSAQRHSDRGTRVACGQAILEVGLSKENTSISTSIIGGIGT